MTTAPPQSLITTAVKLNVEILDARNLLPKDGQGNSSPYVIVDFDGQKKRTSTKQRDLNPVWNEVLVFEVSDPENLESEELEVEVFTDRKGSGSAGPKKRQSLGKVKLYGSQFARRGEEGLVYFPLQKKSIFSWIRGDIGLRIYYYGEQVGEEQRTPESSDPQPPPETKAEEVRKSDVFVAEGDSLEVPTPSENAKEGPLLRPVESKSPMVRSLQPEAEVMNHIPPEGVSLHQVEVPRRSEVRKMHAVSRDDKARVSRKTNGNYSPRVIPGRFNTRRERDNLVEPMQYLFVRVVKGRHLPRIDGPYIKIQTDTHCLKSKPACYRSGSSDPEWNQVFAIGHNRTEAAAATTLEVSVWAPPPTERFLGGVCFDVSDAPVRDLPDSPLATRWYSLEGVIDGVSGEIQLAIWIGTQADEAFPESSSSDAPNAVHTRPKVYQSPKLWYLRVTVVEAQDLRINAAGHPPLLPPDIRVKGQLGFQVQRTRRGSMGGQTTSSLLWFEDFFFVAGEPLEDQLIVAAEDRSRNEPGFLGQVVVPLASIEQRLDERHVPSKWYGLDGGHGSYCGRISLRLCLEGGYHVLDEAAQMCSDYLPTAKPLWRPPVGILELGILGARGLLPMKNKGGGKGSTDAYCVAKYGKKWVRTKTIGDTFDPRWNEQYTWQVFDPCTVLTVGVFDNWRMFGDAAEIRPDYRIGKVRIRISTLESNRLYLSSYPLLVLTRTGLRKMGEIELAARFSCPSLLPETLAVYGQPLLPRMHYLRPLGVTQQEGLRAAAVKMAAAWLAQAEPPLGAEVVRYMLDADSHAWSMRKSKANWFRVVAVLGWAVGLARWLDDIRRWRNGVTTVLVHVLYLVLVWYPDLIVPTGFLYVILMGVWYYRFRPKVPAGMDARVSYAEAADAEELDEEFDTMPSSRAPEVVRARYDRLRVLAGRIQTVLGDVATQGERVQALVSWRDPRATKLFIGVCLLVTVVLYTVPSKMVAVALGFYFLRHPMFREPMPATSLNFFRRLPSKTDMLM